MSQPDQYHSQAPVSGRPEDILPTTEAVHPPNAQTEVVEAAGVYGHLQEKQSEAGDGNADVWELDSGVFNPVAHAPSTAGVERGGMVLCVSRRTRLVLASCATVGEPTPEAHAEAIERALAAVRADPTLGGVPSTIWIDGGKDTMSGETRAELQQLGIELRRADPHAPASRGLAERMLRVEEAKLRNVR